MNTFKSWILPLVLVITVPVFAQHGAGGHVGGAGHMSGHAMERNDMHGKANAGAVNKSVSERLSDNQKLAAKLQSLLPEGTNLQTAASGFKNLGQFVAAVHVSHNLGIPFAELKSKMLGPPAESLGKAIQQLKPSVEAKAERKRAERQANDDLRETKTES
ncbi:MAG TPA: hypothetical protein VGR50_01830 [Terriglobales bacterium]|nr:hypothetical protein [Terriglobales bacterium]